MCTEWIIQQWLNEGSLFCIHTNCIDLQRATFNTTGCLYLTQAHVLAVVANTQVRALRAKLWRRVPCEQPLHMGQSILRPREVPLWAAVRACLVRVCASWSKGNRVNIPESRRSELRSFHMEPEDAGRSPGKICLFFVIGVLAWNRLIGDRHRGPVERWVWSSVWCCNGRALKIRGTSVDSRLRSYP